MSFIFPLRSQSRLPPARKAASSPHSAAAVPSATTSIAPVSILGLARPSPRSRTGPFTATTYAERAASALSWAVPTFSSTTTWVTPVRSAQVEKNQPAVVAPPVHPAHQNDVLPRMFRAEALHTSASAAKYPKSLKVTILLLYVKAPLFVRTPSAGFLHPSWSADDSWVTVRRLRPKPLQIAIDPVDSARAAGLRATSRTPNPASLARRRGKGFAYTAPDGSLLRDRETLGRIRSLVIPPAWGNVWICPSANGHLQATGRRRLRA